MSGATDGRAWRARIAALVEREIVPRLCQGGLVGAEGRSGPHPCGTLFDIEAPLTGRDAIEADLAARRLTIGDAALAEDLSPVDDPVRATRFAIAAARSLGVFWVEDSCSFVEVATALARLSSVARAPLSALAGACDATPESGPAIVLAAPLGETHVFGVSVAAAVFRRAGWRAVDLGCADPRTLAAVAARERAAAVGVSLGSSRALAGGEALVAAVRAAPGLAEAPVILGGAHPYGLDADARRGLAKALGADGAAATAAEAAMMARRLARGRPRRVDTPRAGGRNV